MSAFLAPIFGAGWQFFNNQGIVLSGGKLTTYLAGSTTQQATWPDSTGTGSPNANPIIFDSTGRIPNSGEIWLTTGIRYKFVLTDANNNILGTWDNLSGINDTSSSTSEWTATGLLPAFVNANQFTVPGNFTGTFPVYRRVQIAISTGTVYGYVTASSYNGVSNLTTVSVILDSGNLDTGTNAVSVGFLNPVNPSIPQNYVKTRSNPPDLVSLAKSNSIVSAATVDLSTANGNEVHITGNTGPITSFGTTLPGTQFKLIFDSNPQVNYNATSMILPGAANITVAAGDAFDVVSEGSGNNRVLSWNRANGLPAVVSASIEASIRQSVLSGTIDSNGYANWLSAGTGLAVSLAATATAVQLAFATGFNAFGQNDLVTQLTTDAANAFASLAASNTSYLTEDWVSAVAATPGSTLSPPQYGYSFDRTRASLLHFDGSNGQTTTTDDWGNTVTLTGATLSTAAQKFGTASLNCTTTTQFGDIAITQLPNSASLCLEIFHRRGSTASATAILLEAGNGSSFGARVYLTASNFLACDLSSNGSSNDIGTITGASAMTADGAFHHVALAYDSLAGKYFLYLDGVSQGSITTTSHICAITKIRINANVSAGTTGDTGFYDEFRLSPFCPYPAGTTFTPPVSPFTVNQAGQLSNFFSIPQMAMFEVTSASVTATVNPGMTARNRLFVGEADTTGAAVSAVRNYAFLRRYESAFFTPASQTWSFQNHNIGHQSLTYEVILECINADSGYTPGDIIPLTAATNGTAGFNIGVEFPSRNTAAVGFNTNVAYILNKGTLGLNVLTFGNWRGKVRYRSANF